MKNKDFAIFILTHGRADNVITCKFLKDSNYTGKTYFIIDDEDPEQEKYIKNFGKDNVIIFSKEQIEKEFDIMDNFEDRRAVVYARNKTFDIARDLGLKYFMMLDDDYSGVAYAFTKDFKFKHKPIKNIDKVLDGMIDFYKSTNIKSIAFAQAGDYIGGDNGFAYSITRLRKCMNTFLCSPDRPFKFVGRINEDVNTYVLEAKHGSIFLTIPWVKIIQKQTQANKGGLTDIYLNYGTYVKSFYTVMINPSSVRVAEMGSRFKRIHHRVEGSYTYPMIIRESIKNNGK